MASGRMSFGSEGVSIVTEAKGKAELNFREGEGAWRSFLHQPLSNTISSPCSWKGPLFLPGKPLF